MNRNLRPQLTQFGSFQRREVESMHTLRLLRIAYAAAELTLYILLDMMARLSG